ncbi:MAG: hypothetical protein AAGB01_08175 [Cyanobacteria bacterium P01_F01_bin.42]
MQLEELLSHLKTSHSIPFQSVGEKIWRASLDWGEMVMLLSEEDSWLRLMVPISSVSQAQPFLQELLELNFEATTIVKYAIAQQMLWAVFNHPLASLQEADVAIALERLIALREQGLSNCFEIHADRQVSLIIAASKRQGLTLESTLQNLERFYREGIIGDLSDTDATIQLTLDRWRSRLERLWSEDDES